MAVGCLISTAPQNNRCVPTEIYMKPGVRADTPRQKLLQDSKTPRWKLCVYVLFLDVSRFSQSNVYHICKCACFMSLSWYEFSLVFFFSPSHRPNCESQTNEQLNLEAHFISSALVSQLPGGRATAEAQLGWRHAAYRVNSSVKTERVIVMCLWSLSVAVAEFLHCMSIDSTRWHFTLLWHFLCQSNCCVSLFFPETHWDKKKTIKLMSAH